MPYQIFSLRFANMLMYVDLCLSIHFFVRIVLEDRLSHDYNYEGFWSDVNLNSNECIILYTSKYSANSRNISINEVVVNRRESFILALSLPQRQSLSLLKCRELPSHTRRPHLLTAEVSFLFEETLQCSSLSILMEVYTFEANWTYSFLFIFYRNLHYLSEFGELFPFEIVIQK